MMISNSPTHRVPDHEVLLGGSHEESFYNEVFPAPVQRPEQMDTTDSDCVSESAEDKVYMPLLPERKLFGNSSLISQKLIPLGHINIHSWKTRHPRNWLSQDITNWIYFVCSKMEHMDRYKIQAEKFNELCGEQLCSMSLDDFIKREPSCGEDLYYCLQDLLQPANYKAPDYCPEIEEMDELNTRLECNDNSTMWSAAVMMPQQDLEMSLIRPVDLDLESVGAGIAVIDNKEYDISCNDRFDDMPHVDESGYESGDSGSLSPVSDSLMSSVHEVQSNIVCDMTSVSGEVYSTQDQPAGTMISAAFNLEQSYPGQMPSASHIGRSKPSSHVPAPRGRKPGKSATKGNHLWKFIRDVINDSRYNPDVIRWENKDQGIFRIVNSAEIARLWGEKKNNSSMTYEKFSRAMRDYYKSDILRRVGSRKLVYGFGAKVFPHLVCYQSYRWPGMMAVHQTC